MMDIERFELGRRIYGAMISKGLSITDVATRAGVPRPLVVDLVLSEKAVDTETVRKITDAVGIDPPPE